MTHAHPHSPDPHHHHPHHETHDHSWWVRIAEVFHLPGFGHDHGDDLRQDETIYANELGVRTIKLALLALMITTLLQVLIYAISGSVALLADTVHNLGDALNSIPLLVAFWLARRAPNRRYTYGYGRAEDIAGLFIVLSIAFSAAYILYESIYKLIYPQPLDNVGWVAAAAIIGFVGNELVALMQIRVGRKIGSEAMVADGLHARTDGLTSLAVLIAAAGTWLGAPVVDPLVGIFIGLAIVGITWNASKTMWYRLMDAVDPSLIAEIEHAVQHVPKVKAIQHLRARWIGHQLNIELVLNVDQNLSVAETHQVLEAVRHSLKHHIANLTSVNVQFEPAEIAEKPALP